MSRARVAASWLAAGLTIFVALRGVLGLSRLGAPFEYGYNDALLSISYFGEGFARRALPGTLVHPFTAPWTSERAWVYHLISAAFLAVPIALILVKLARRDLWPWLWLALVAIISPQLFRGWAGDVARGDMLTAGFLAWACLAALNGSLRLAVLPLLLGLLAHETAIVFGGPLLVALWWLRRDAGDVRTIAVPLLLLVAGIAAVLIAQHLLSAPQADLLRAMRPAIPNLGTEVAQYMTVGGLRTILASHCMMFSTPIPWLAIPMALIVLVATWKVLLLRAPRALQAAAIASLLPLAAMFVLGHDYGRWTMLAVMNAWLAAAAARVWGVEQGRPSGRRWAVAVGLLAALTLAGPATYYHPAKLTLVALTRYAGTPPLPIRAFDRCDPEWRTLIR